MMPKYRIYGKVNASKYLGEFSADSVDDAIQKAYDSEECCVCLCHQCASDAENAEIEIDESCVEEIDDDD
ncbi:MAG: hypothetical protein ACOYNK_06870 [Microbacteriaceae bacterium]